MIKTRKEKMLEARIARLEKLLSNENAHAGIYESNEDLLNELGLDYSAAAYDHADYALDHISKFFRNYLLHYFSSESNYLSYLDEKISGGLSTSETSDFASMLPNSFGKVSRSKKLWKNLTSLAAKREKEQFKDAMNNEWVEFIDDECIVNDTNKYPLFDKDVRWNNKRIQRLSE